jgi:hypothetical protein
VRVLIFERGVEIVVENVVVLEEAIRILLEATQMP